MKVKVTFGAALAPIAWGTTYATVTGLYPPDRPLFVATSRVAPAALVLLAIGGLQRPRGGDWLRCAALALFNFALFFPLLAVAVYRLPGGVAAAVGGLQPLLVTGASWVLTGRRPRAWEVAVGAVAVVGVALVVTRPGAGFDPVGVLAAVAANVSFAVGVVLARRFPAPANRLAWTGWQLLLGAAMLAPLTLAVEGVPTLTPRALGGIAYLSLIATATAFVLWFAGIRELPVVAPPVLGLLAPVTGAVLGWALLGQALAPSQLVGFVVTLAAVGYGAIGSQRRDQTTIDDEVGPGDVGGPVAGQQRDEVADFVRPGEPTGHRLAGRRLSYGLRVAAAGRRDRRRDTVVAEPQIGTDGAWADGVHPYTPRTDLFGQ
jgi:probable blue pigment (indigoidine) exporter